MFSLKKEMGAFQSIVGGEAQLNSGLSLSFEHPLVFTPITNLLVKFPGEFYQQQASSSVTTRVYQGYSVLTGVMGYGP